MEAILELTYRMEVPDEDVAVLKKYVADGDDETLQQIFGVGWAEPLTRAIIFKEE